MTPAERQRHALALFDSLCELDTPECAARLDEVAREDAELAQELARLLAADAASDALLDGAPLVPATLLRSPGMQFGGFTLKSLIGRGGMGEVWLAERDQGDFVQRVALKLLRSGDRDDLVRRFLQERRILADLTHPQIARFINGGVADNGQPWYAMSYVEGVAIDVFVHQRALDARAIVRLIAEVALIVAHAHARLVVHRDLKPSNILVDASGRPYLLDFGIAKLLGDTRGSETETGMHAMSPLYAAPEQVLGQTISTATDVFALGLTLYQLLVGELPRRDATSLATLAEAVRNESFVAPSRAVVASSTRRLRIDAELDTIVLMALRAEPERRYRDTAALADDLKRWLEGRTVAAQGDTRTYRLRKFVARNRLAVGSASSALLALILGLGLALWQASEARRQARLANAERERAEQAAIRAERVAEFMTSILNAGDPMTRDSTEEPTIGQVVARAAANVETDLKDSPALQAQVLADLAATAFNANDTANRYAAKAQQLLNSHPDIDATTRSSVARVQGEVLMRAGKMAEAEALMRSALAAVETEFARRPSRNLRKAGSELMNGLATALYVQTQYAESMALMERQLNEVEWLYGKNSLAVAQVTHNLAIGYWTVEQLELAEARIERSLAIHRQLLSADDPRVGMTLSVKASIVDARGRTVDAITLATEALGIAERFHGPESERLSSPLQTLADLHMMRGEFDLAMPMLERVLRLSVADDKAQLRFDAARSIGLIAMYQERYAQAVPWYRQALVHAERWTGGEGMMVPATAGALAWARGMSGEFAVATREFERLRARMEADGSAIDKLVSHYYQGDVALAASDLQGAVAAYRAALAVADAHPAYLKSSFAEQARAGLGLALWPDPAHRDDAQALLEGAIAAMEKKEMGWHPLIVRARSVLDRAKVSQE